jgi:ketosteroid isomerase-like protein
VREIEEGSMGEVEEFLDTFVPRQEAADEALHNGDPEPRMELWSREDPITVLGAFGMAASGWEEASETFRWVASQFSKCEGFRLELIAAGISGDLAYTVGFEHSTVSRDGGPMQSHRLRVTHVYRRENGEWKIAHRHGDALQAERAPSTAQED